MYLYTSWYPLFSKWKSGQSFTCFYLLQGAGIGLQTKAHLSKQAKAICKNKILIDASFVPNNNEAFSNMYLEIITAFAHKASVVIILFFTIIILQAWFSIMWDVV